MTTKAVIAKVDIARVEQLIEEGLTRKQLSEALGLDIEIIYSVTGKYREKLQANSFNFRMAALDAEKREKQRLKEQRRRTVAEQKLEAKRKKHEAWVQSKLHIKEMFVSGMTMSEIGVRLGVSRERIRQLLKKLGVTKFDGGIHVRDAGKKENLDPKPHKFAERFGLTRTEYAESKKNGMLRAYQRQLHNAKLRGIEWDFTAKTWMNVWLESGKWALRGRNSGQYVMSRINDCGPYSPENVQIKTCNENASEATLQWVGKTKDVVGVFEVHKGARKPYLAKFKKKYLGMYETKEQALAARQVAMNDGVSA